MGKVLPFQRKLTFNEYLECLHLAAELNSRGMEEAAKVVVAHAAYIKSVIDRQQARAERRRRLRGDKP